MAAKTGMTTIIRMTTMAGTTEMTLMPGMAQITRMARMTRIKENNDKNGWVDCRDH